MINESLSDLPFALSLRMCDLCGVDAGVVPVHRYTCDDHSPRSVREIDGEYRFKLCTACSAEIGTVRDTKNSIGIEKIPF